MTNTREGRIYLIGNPNDWLAWAKTNLTCRGYRIVETPQDADLVLVDRCNEECLSRIPLPIRKRTIVLCTIPSYDFARWVLNSGFKDITLKPLEENKLEQIVAKALNSICHLV